MILEIKSIEVRDYANSYDVQGTAEAKDDPTTIGKYEYIKGNLIVHHEEIFGEVVKTYGGEETLVLSGPRTDAHDEERTFKCHPFFGKYRDSKYMPITKHVYKFKYQFVSRDSEKAVTMSEDFVFIPDTLRDDNAESFNKLVRDEVRRNSIRRLQHMLDEDLVDLYSEDQLETLIDDLKEEGNKVVDRDPRTHVQEEDPSESETDELEEENEAEEPETKPEPAKGTAKKKVKA